MSKMKRLKKAFEAIEECEKVVNDEKSTTKDMLKAMVKATKKAHKALYRKK